MQISALVTLFVSAVAVTAVPMADADANADAAPVRMETRDLNRADCGDACSDAAALGAFCRLIPFLPGKVACWGVAAALKTDFGEDACIDFCDEFF